MPPTIVSAKPAKIAPHAVHGRHPARPARRGVVAVPGSGATSGEGSGAAS